MCLFGLAFLKVYHISTKDISTVIWLVSFLIPEMFGGLILTFLLFECLPLPSFQHSHGWTLFHYSSISLDSFHPISLGMNPILSTMILSTMLSCMTIKLGTILQYIHSILNWLGIIVKRLCTILKRLHGIWNEILHWKPSLNRLYVHARLNWIDRIEDGHRSENLISNIHWWRTICLHHQSQIYL